MNTHTRLAAAIALGFAATAAIARADTFPAAKDQPASCDSITWPQVLVSGYPKVIDACQEVVLTRDGTKWARFDGKFVRLDRDGKLTFGIQDSRDRHVDDVAVTPSPNQVAFIDGRETKFKDLVRGQRVNLYLPEGASGFTTQVGEPVSQVANIETKRPSEQAVASERPLAPAAETSSLVHFILGSAALTADAKRMLDQQVTTLRDHPNANVSLAGHTSASASESFNQKLSERRAEAVRDYLVNSGDIARNRVTIAGYGEMRPLERETNPLDLNSNQARANMRVEVLIGAS